MTPSRRDAKPEEMAGERASGCARIGASPQWLSEIDGYRKGLDEGGKTSMLVMPYGQRWCSVCVIY